MSGQRVTWEEYFMMIAEVASSRCTCFSVAKGAAIVVDGHVVSTGYNGAPAGVRNCKYDIGVCRKRSLGYGHGEGHNECLAVHAEANAILSAGQVGVRIRGGTLYCTHKPCSECTKLIINSGITKIVYKHDYESDLADILLKEANVAITCINAITGGDLK